MTNVFITGASGQLGKSFLDLQSGFTSLNIRGLPHKQFDITEEADYHSLDDQGIDVVINCAAYAKVDEAEDDPDKCYSINATGPAKLARYCYQKKLGFIHFSSDYVYHNAQRTPLTEESSTEPKGVYAKSKLIGEQQVLTAHSDALIFRVSWLYAPHGKNFVKTIINLCKHRSEVKVVDDQLSAPTYAYDLAGAVLTIVARQEHMGTQFTLSPGIYNYANEGVVTPYEMAMAIRDHMGLSCKLIPVSLSDYSNKVTRPEYSVLNLAKFKQNCNIPIPHWRTSLVNCLNKLKTY